MVVGIYGNLGIIEGDGFLKLKYCGWDVAR